MNQPDNTRPVADLMPLNAAAEILASDSATAALLTVTAQQAVLPRRLDEGIYGVLDADCAVQIVETPGYQERRIDDWAKEHAAGPDKLVRSATVLTVDSFLDYLDRHTEDPGEGSTTLIGERYLFGRGSLEVWADVDQRTVTGILDGIDGWRRNKVTIALKTSREFSEWMAIDGKLLAQAEFAQFIEDHLSTIGEPDAAILLDICQTLEGRTNAAFKMSNRLTNGARQFTWAETVEAKAGEKGDLTIPEGLTLVMRIFQGSDPVAMEARFRYRPSDSGMRLAVKLTEPEVALEKAFADVVFDVQAQLPVHVSYGRP